MQGIETKKSESPEKTVHLNRYFHFTELMRDPEVEARLLRYPSNFDGSMQSVFTLTPKDRKPKRLFFFFHGMDGDAGDGVVVRQIVKDNQAKIICPGGRGPGWVSDAFLADAEQVIRTHSKGFKEFTFIGISMGGTQALALPAFLAKGLQTKLKGVVALLPGSDLAAIQKRAGHPRVRETLLRSAAGKEEELAERSPVNLISRYPAGLPFVIFYPDEDLLMLTPELEAFVKKLREGGFPAASFKFEGGHLFTPKHFNYKEIIDVLGQNIQSLREGGPDCNVGAQLIAPMGGINPAPTSQASLPRKDQKRVV